MLSKNINGNSFFDFFAGTTSVSRFFKKRNYQIFASDLMYFSFVLQQAYITNNEKQDFRKLLAHLNYKSPNLFSNPLETVIEFLNQIHVIDNGFIYQNYTPAGTSNLDIPRMYFSNENGKIIDSIRQEIEHWKTQNVINNNEYSILLACLIETVPFYANISGVYSAFHKKWDPRAVKKLILRPICPIFNRKENFSYNHNSTELIDKINADIFYLDPPYNQRQYAPNYHILETIAKYDDPEIKGVTGMRNYKGQKSNFCNSKTALEELKFIADNGNFKYLILSYNSEGIMQQKDIISLLEKTGKTDFIDFDYRRYKSNNKGVPKKLIKENLYILEK